MRAWVTLAAASPVAAIAADEWGWLVFGVAALARAALSHRELRSLPGGTLPAPGVVPLKALELRRSAAARPLRRGEAGLAALVGLLEAADSGPVAARVATATRTAVRLVDGLRTSARRVLACESAMRAVADPAHRAEIHATSNQLLVGMDQAAGLVDELLAAASRIVGAVATAASAPRLAELTDEVERLRTYADGLSELLGTGGTGDPA